MSWISGPLLAFDLETTGTDVETDRIVTAAVVRLEADGSVSRERTWLLDPGVAIPEQASAIHGISTERARAHGAAGRGRGRGDRGGRRRGAALGDPAGGDERAVRPVPARP